jgi:hypothetical protein
MSWRCRRAAFSPPSCATSLLHAPAVLGPRGVRPGRPSRAAGKRGTRVKAAAPHAVAPLLIARSPVCVRVCAFVLLAADRTPRKRRLFCAGSTPRCKRRRYARKPGCACGLRGPRGAAHWLCWCEGAAGAAQGRYRVTSTCARTHARTPRVSSRPGSARARTTRTHTTAHAHARTGARRRGGALTF